MTNAQTIAIHKSCELWMRRRIYSRNLPVEIISSRQHPQEQITTSHRRFDWNEDSTSPDKILFCSFLSPLSHIHLHFLARSFAFTCYELFFGIFFCLFIHWLSKNRFSTSKIDVETLRFGRRRLVEGIDEIFQLNFFFIIISCASPLNFALRWSIWVKQMKKNLLW